MTDISRTIPRHYIHRFGKMGVLKGTIDIKVGETGEGEDTKDIINKLSLYSWDVVEECRIKQCPAHSSCTYTKSGKCGVMMQYMKATSTMFFHNFAHELDEASFYRIGMHLMPLYRILCKLKIAEVGVLRVIITGGGGRKYVNPIFREIRDTIKTIESLWTNIGLNTKIASPEPNFSTENKKGDYYSMLESGVIQTKEERSLLKRVKVRGR